MNKKTNYLVTTLFVIDVINNKFSEPTILGVVKLALYIIYFIIVLKNERTKNEHRRKS